MKRFTKKLVSVLLVLALLSALYVSAFAGELKEESELMLYSGTVKVHIVVDNNCSEQEYFAAEVLNDYINRMTGFEPGITKGDFSEYSNYIAVGSGEYTGLDTPAENGYIIKSDSRGVKIAGSGNKGAVRGAYRFLEKFCGCHWYAHDCIVVPSRTSISVPADINVNYKPFFEYGECDTNSSLNPEFNVANGGSGGQYCVIPEVMGGSVRYISSFCHTLTTQYCSSAKYFDEHPEYFALHGGKRVPTQLCLTNPDVLEIVKSEVLDTIAQNYNPNGVTQIISITQNDNYDFCECDRCKALDDANGSHAGTMVTFANAISEVIKDYKNAAIDTFAYQYTRKVPTNVIPNDNVIIRLCSIECCFGHALKDEKCEQNAEFMADLKGWGKICSRVYVWDYVNNYKHTFSTFANFGTMQANTQTFCENGVKGLYEEGNYYINSCDAEFGELKTYLLTRLIDDPYCDFDAETDGFLKAYYGPGWKNIKEFITIITKRAVTDKEHMGIYQHAAEALPAITNKEIKKCNELWAAAFDEAETNLQKQRIARSELSWRVWKCSNKKSEFSRLRFVYKWMKAQDDLYNDLRNSGIVQIGECWDGTSNLSDVEVLHYIFVPDAWTVGAEGRAICKYNDFCVKIFQWMDKHFGS